jgi:predicted Zn-dependent protease
MHYWWSRAWLLGESGRRAEAAVALEQLDLVSTQPGDRQSLPVMSAWLAFTRGDIAAANTALTAMNVDADDDASDLYVFARIREAQGDVAGAERLRQRVRSGVRTLTKAVVVQRMARDATTSRP